MSLWGLRYGIQMEEVLRALGAHYTDVYQSETLAAKRDFVLACLFGCQQALAARRRSHSHAVKSVAMRVREYVDAEYCSNNNALFESYSRLVRQERIGAIYMPARREVLDFRDPNQVTTLLVKRFEALDVANPDKLGRFFFYPLQKNFLSTETYGEPRRDMVVLGSRQDLEMQVLMSQINPHFLYNPLESIVWKAGEAGRPDIGKLASSLGKLYRLSISGGLFVPLEQELEHVQMYMNIQRSRYGNKVDYEVRLHGVDPDQVEVLKLILQPIVENSLLYGMEGLDHTLRIRVAAWRRGEKMLLTVTDNGVGMDRAALARLRDQIVHGASPAPRPTTAASASGCTTSARGCGCTPGPPAASGSRASPGSAPASPWNCPGAPSEQNLETSRRLPVRKRGAAACFWGRCACPSAFFDLHQRFLTKSKKCRRTAIPAYVHRLFTSYNRNQKRAGPTPRPHDACERSGPARGTFGFADAPRKKIKEDTPCKESSFPAVLSSSAPVWAP